MTELISALCWLLQERQDENVIFWLPHPPLEGCLLLEIPGRLVWELGEWGHRLLSFKCPSEEHPSPWGMSLQQTGGLGL